MTQSNLDHSGAYSYASAPPRTGTHREMGPPTTADPTDAVLRLQVIDRLRLMNTRQAMHAWDRRRKEPLGPHGIAFLYYDPVGEGHATPRRFEVRLATRLFLDGADVRNLPGLVRSIAGIVAEYATRGRFDLRATMTNRHDPMSPDARYTGVAVSSLDSEVGAWEDTQRLAMTPLDVPGRCHALLGDGTRLLLDRSGTDAGGDLGIRSSRPLETMSGPLVRSWGMLFDDDEYDPRERAEWNALEQLHDAVLHATGARHAERHRLSRW